MQENFVLKAKTTIKRVAAISTGALMMGLTAAGAAAAAVCCCETQKLIVAEATRTRELILTTELQNAKDSLSGRGLLPGLFAGSVRRV